MDQGESDMHRPHGINPLTAFVSSALMRYQALEAQLKQATDLQILALLSPQVYAAKRKLRQGIRALERERRHASWPYCGARHMARIARQFAAGSIREDNGLDLNFVGRRQQQERM